MAGLAAAPEVHQLGEDLKKLHPQVSQASTASGSNSDDNSSLSDGSGSDSSPPRPRRQVSAAVAEASKTPPPAAAPLRGSGLRAQPRREAPLPLGPLAPRLPLLRLTHSAIFFGCRLATRAVLGFRTFLARFLSGSTPKDELVRPEARVTWELLCDASDPCEAARAALPVPPPFPEPPAEGIKISFGPCANLMIYTAGVACCLQRCPNYAEVFPRLRFYGVSCGAFVASTMAANCDMLTMLPEMMAWTVKFQGRLWGLIGAYSETITDICWRLFSEPSRFESARGRLGIGVTAFRPSPERVAVESFGSANELVTTLLGSCYIPVAFETPQWSEDMGPLWDGGILEFQTHGDVVVSPYESLVPDVFPRSPYPRKFTFFSPHQRDAVRIFEDGYMDCLRWLEAGAPTRTAERSLLPGGSASSSSSDGGASGLGPLLGEARRFLVDIIWGSRATGDQAPPS